MNMELPGGPHSREERLQPLTAEPARLVQLPQSLRAKGYLFNALLLAYIVFIVIYALSHRNQPLEQLHQYQRIQQAQEALVQADLAAFHIVTVLFSDVNRDELVQVVGYFASLREQYENLQQWFPEQADTFGQLVASIPAIVDEPSEEYLRQIQFHLARSKSELDRLMQVNRQQLADLVRDYRDRNDAVVVNIMLLGILGLVILGGLISLFINQLKRDINFLQHRTEEIIEGYRGKPLAIYRNDEVGQLTQGVNHMASALAEREKLLEIQRNKTSFVEKMAAIDSLAGGIAHEIGNPIASIVGLADVIKNDDDSRLSADGRRNLECIVQYGDGLVRLTRELSAFDSHKTDEFSWLDVNQLITNARNIFHYDQRWFGIDITLQLDRSIPALFASEGQLTQLLNNLMENAREAMGHADAPVVTISTRPRGVDKIELSVEDNGRGMTPDTREHIFDPFFSTKPTGQGTGLGLSICWTIAKNHNGTIHGESTPGKGSKISVVLPVSPQPGA